MADNAGPLKRVVVVAVVVVFVLVLVLEMGADAAELARLDRGTRGGENLPPCQNDFVFSGRGFGKISPSLGKTKERNVRVVYETHYIVCTKPYGKQKMGKST